MRLSRVLRGIAALAACAMLVLAGLFLGRATKASQTQRAEQFDCKKPNASASAATRRPRQRIVLQPDPNSQTRVTNFGEDRDPEYPAYAIKSDQALDGVKDRLVLTAETIARTGKETAETVTFPEPTFTDLTVSGSGKRVRFRVCLAPPSSLPSGQYTGLVNLDGPPGVEGTTVTVTANAKSKWLFWIGIAVSLILALLVLFFKGVADARGAKIEKAHSDDAAQAEARRWKPAIREIIGDLGWWATTAFALGATFAILWALYENDPAWGESGLGSVLALVGAGVGAVGAKTIFTPASK